MLPLVFKVVIAINLSFTQTAHHDQIVLFSVFSDGDGPKATTGYTHYLIFRI